jgi:hypothetical protein
MPITPNTAAGTISAQNASPTTNTVTNNSCVQIPPIQQAQLSTQNGTTLDPGAQTVTVSVFGTYTGALTPRGTVDGVNWFTLSGTAVTNTSTGATSSTIASAAQGIFQINVSGLQGIRINAEGAVTGSAFVAIWESSASGTLYPSSQQGTQQWVQSVAAPQSGSATVIKASAGFLQKVIVTTLGTAQLNIYDNASAGSGTIIGIVPASTPVGTVLTFNSPAVNGITIGGAASQPALTVFFA